jgi:hypothetical protein
MINFRTLRFGWRQEAISRSQHAFWLLVGAVASIVMVLLFVLLSQRSGGAAATGVGGIIVLASVSSGAFFGFLFSVPRIMTKDNAAAATGAPVDSDLKGVVRSERLLSSNTNLERVSEWLTTMLVGVGLTQIGSLDDRLLSFSDFLNERMTVAGNGASTLPAVAPFLLMSGLVTGFIFFYLYTRIYLSPLFQYAERVLSLGGLPLEDGAPKVREAAANLAEARKNPAMKYTSTASEISIDDSLEVILNLLYEDDGYRKAIDIGNTLAGTPAGGIAQYWYLMAAAYGQKHHALLLSGAPAPELHQARIAVLGACRKAVQLNYNYKSRLMALTNPVSANNDLQDFEVDSDFLQIVK